MEWRFDNDFIIFSSFNRYHGFGIVKLDSGFTGIGSLMLILGLVFIVVDFILFLG